MANSWNYFFFFPPPGEVMDTRSSRKGKEKVTDDPQTEKEPNTQEIVEPVHFAQDHNTKK